MKGVIKSFSLAFKIIFTDPVNFILCLLPAMIALILYLITIVMLYQNSDWVFSLFSGYLNTADQGSILAKILSACLVIFLFLIMSWTFVIAVGIISAPFNSVLSARIEQKLVQRIIMDEDQTHAIEQVKISMGLTFKNEFKKIIFLCMMATVAFVFNMIPLLYPLSLFLAAVMLSVQFVDFSWSRHNLLFIDCLKDVLRNILPYSLGGMVFLFLVAIPLVNAFIPSFATSYFTILWLLKQNKIYF
jgi:CysZ protein